MGNCYGEDGDSEDEYYGYYGKNNRLKPKPNPTPPEPYLQPESESEEDKGYELEGLEYKDDEGERYELEYEGDKEEELEELGPEDEEDEVLGTDGEAIQYEHRELENGEIGLYEHTGRGPRTQGDEHEAHQLGCELEYGVDETSEHGEPDHEDGDGYTHPVPTPTHVPHPRDIPHSNQRGRTTTLKDVQHRASPYPTLRHPPTHTPPIEPAHGTVPTLSITQSHPPPWPNDTHNTHLPQSRPPPWPD
jgi:hypothetical protein